RCLKEKLSGLNFNDWFCSPEMVLRCAKEKILFVIEHLISPALPIDSTAQVLAQWNAVYDAHNEVSCLMLGSMTPELHGQLENSSPYEMLQELKSMFNKQAGVERNFVGFVRNYNMHNMGKTIGELHALLIEYEKGLPKKAVKEKARERIKVISLSLKKPKTLCKSTAEDVLPATTAKRWGIIRGIVLLTLLRILVCGTQLVTQNKVLEGERKLKQGVSICAGGNGVRAQVGSYWNSSSLTGSHYAHIVGIWKLLMMYLLLFPLTYVSKDLEHVLHGYYESSIRHDKEQL
ncbi:hypothetical protein Tco_0702504, partial [Tanacetum coccineum]